MSHFEVEKFVSILVIYAMHSFSTKILCQFTNRGLFQTINQIILIYFKYSTLKKHETELFYQLFGY